MTAIRFITRSADIPSGNYERQTFFYQKRGPQRVHVATIGKIRDADRYTIIPALVIAETCGFGHTLSSMAAARRHVADALVSAGYAGPLISAPQGR